MAVKAGLDVTAIKVGPFLPAMVKLQDEWLHAILDSRPGALDGAHHR